MMIKYQIYNSKTKRNYKRVILESCSDESDCSDNNSNPISNLFSNESSLIKEFSKEEKKIQKKMKIKEKIEKYKKRIK